MTKEFNIFVRRQGGKYTLTNWGNNNKNTNFSRAKSIMKVIDKNGIYKFTGVKIIDQYNNQIYCEERMTEQKAKSVRGFLLYNPVTDQRFFRVYSEDKKTYKDFNIRVEDLEIEILSSNVSLFEDGDIKHLDWSSDYLARATTV
jgi:hypothetical protein